MRIFYGWIIAGVVCLTWAVSIGPRQAFSVFLLALLQDFGSSRTATAAVFSIHMASYSLGGWILGALVDRLGPRRVIAWSIAYFSLLFVRGPSRVAFLSIFILACGMATGGGPPVFATFLTDRLQGPRLGYLLGLQNIGFGMGATFGPLLAGALFDLMGGYAVAFVLMVVAMIISAVMVSATARRTPGLPR